MSLSRVSIRSALLLARARGLSSPAPLVPLRRPVVGGGGDPPLGGARGSFRAMKTQGRAWFSSASAPQAKEGDKVQVHYTGSLEDGSVFDSSAGREPLEFVLGEKKVIPGFEKGLLGLAVGESRTITIPPEEAYGPHDKEMVFSVPRNRGPEGVKIGDRVQLNGGMPAVIVAVDEDSVRIDANHILAGKTLIFKLELVKIL